MSDEIEKVPTWGYKGQESKLFDLGPDDELPEGWADSPTPAGEPSKSAATDEPVGSEDGSADLDAENASLKEQVADLEAQNASLTAQLEAARAELVASSDDDEDLKIPHPGAPKEPDLVEIPEDWRGIHHSTRMKLAKTLSPDMADAIEKDADAIEIIEAELVKRG